MDHLNKNKVNLGTSIINDSFSTFRMEENKKLITQSTKDTHQKKYKFNPIGHHLRSKAIFDDNSNGFACEHTSILYKNHRRQSKSSKSLQGQNPHEQNVKPNMDHQLNHLQIQRFNDWNSEKTEKSKCPFQKKRVNNIYKWSINQLLNYMPSPKHIRKNLLPISNPDQKKQINNLLQLYRNNFYMRKHYCLTMTKIFEETIQEIDEDMFFIHKIIKQTEGTTFKEERPNVKKQKNNRKMKKPCIIPQIKTELEKLEMNDVKTERSTSKAEQSKGKKQKFNRKLVKPIVKGYEELKPQEEIDINVPENVIEHPVSPPIDPIEDATNTLRFLGLSPLKEYDQDITNSDKESAILERISYP